MSAKILQIDNNRKKKNTPGGGVMKHLGLFLVALALVGLVFASFFSGLTGLANRKLIFGRYGNKNIVFTYNNAFGQAISYAMQQSSNIIPRVTWRQVFDDIVVRTAITWQLEKNGYVPSPRAVDRRIVENAFQTDGKFDEKQYREASDSSKATLRTSYQDNIAIETWTEDTLSGLYRSKAQKDFFAEMRADTRNYNYIVLPFNEYPAEDVTAYAGEHAELFRSRNLSRITLDDETKAAEITGLYEDTRQNVTAFADLAREHSVDAYKDDGGSIGETQYHVLLDILSEEDAASVFNLATGDIAGPFSTDYGWIVFHADSDVTESDPEAMLDDIRTYMISNDAGIIEDALLAKAAEIRELALSAETFSETMEEQGYETKETGAFSFNYAGDRLIGNSLNTGSDNALLGANNSDEFWTTIVSLKEIGDISEPVVLNNAIGLFSLISMDKDGMEDIEEYWDDIVRSETAQIMQSDFKDILLKNESKLFDDRFNETYKRIYGE